MIHGSPLKGLGLDEAAHLVFTGFWSEKVKAFISDDKMQCLSEMYDCDLYHVITDPDGKQIPIYLFALDSD